MLSLLKNLILSLPLLAVYTSIFTSDEISLNVKINVCSITFMVITFFLLVKIFYDYIEPSKNNKIYLPYGEVSDSEEEDNNSQQVSNEDDNKQNEDNENQSNTDNENYQELIKEKEVVLINNTDEVLNDDVKNNLVKLGNNCECYTDENYFYVDKNCTLQCLLEHPQFKNLIIVNSKKND